ncbi:MAG: heme exporter protein CcmB [Candidatus Eisenbacteria bacterium]|nr:heme exporter protein CcmB [Candidatus Eisenbacteria bacterium]
MPQTGSRSAAAVWTLLRKECRSEWRTRYGLNAALLFAVASLTAVSFAAGRMANRPDVLAALFWIVLLFATLASLGHAFVREVEGRTMLLLRLVASPTEIATGKLLFNLLFLLVVEGVTVPLFLLLTGAPPVRWGPFAAVLALGTVSLAASSTLVGAVIAQTRGRGALFAGVSLPLLLPVLAAAVAGTRDMWASSPTGGSVRLLAAYAVALIAAGLLLYEHLWED